MTTSFSVVLFCFQLGPNDIVVNLPEKKSLQVKWCHVYAVDLCDESGRMYITVKNESVSFIRAMLQMRPPGTGGLYFNPAGKGLIVMI